MGDKKVRKGGASKRVWALFFGIVFVSSTMTTMVTVASLGLLPWRTAAVTKRDPLSIAEGDGSLQRIQRELGSRVELSIDGNALTLEGTVASDTEIEEKVKILRSNLPALSFYVIRPYDTRFDLVWGRTRAVRDGDFNYAMPGKSVVVINMLKTR